MPAYKDEKQNTWYCQFYYEDWQGNKKKKKKRGFKTKKEAQEWENSYKLSANANMDMKLGEFVEIYFRDKVGELKERSVKNKRYMIEAHIKPYFENKPMNTITPSDIIQWQNIMREKGYAQTYLRMVQNQMTALFTHASNIYNLANKRKKYLITSEGLVTFNKERARLEELLQNASLVKWNCEKVKFHL